MFLPLVAIVAFFALTACSRKGEDCPTGSEGHEIVVDQVKVRLCHQDSQKDGVYQKVSDRLGLQVGDRFIRSEEKDFESYRKKFRLPDFEGLNLKKWAQTYHQVFPQGASGAEADRFLSLQNYLHDKNLNLEDVLSTAQEIPWLDAHSFPIVWEKRGPQEKMDALALAGIVMGILTKGDLFYRREENKNFIDTILGKIREGRLKLQRQTDLKGVNALTEMTGRERSAGYDRVKNTLMLGLPLNPESLRSASNYIHELFHFYQDATRSKLNFLQMESEAYEKQGEFVVLNLKSHGFDRQYGGVDDFIQKEYAQSNPDQPAIWGLRHAQALLENQGAAAEKFQESLLQSTQRFYYVRVLLSQKAPEVGKKAIDAANGILLESEGTPAEAVKKMQGVLQNARDLEGGAFRELENRLRDINTDSPEEIPTEELVERFQKALLASTYRIFLEECLERMESGNFEPFSRIQINLDSPKFLELNRTVTQYQPLKYQRMDMDGVD